MQFLATTNQYTTTVLNTNKHFVSFKSAVQSLIFISAFIVILKIGIHYYRPMQITEFRAVFDETEKSNPWKSAPALKLPYSGSLFCFVMTSIHHESRIKIINQTWLHECDHGEFFTARELKSESIPARAVFAQFSESRDDLFWKILYGFYFSFKRISDQFDWYMKSGDESYIFIDNLRHYLNKFNASKPLYIGTRLEPFKKNDFNSGGVHILSKAAMKLLLKKFYKNETFCNYHPSGDIGLGQCLEKMGITLVDTRDSEERETFVPHEIDQMYTGSFLSESRGGITLDQHKEGFEAFSPGLVSLSYLQPSDFKLVHLVRRHLKTYKNRCRRKDLEI